MNPIDQAIAALEAARYTSNPAKITEANAEALAALRAYREQEQQGFEEWWKQHRYPSFCAMKESDARALFCAGRRAAIPKDLREALMEACAVAAQHATNDREHDRYAEARKRLEAL